jgi:hypothetical protein
MPSTYTSRLRFTLPATGELTNVWGNTVNNGITELVESAIAGAATLSTWGGAGVAYTLSNNNGAADEARCMFLVASGTPGENKNIICPAVTKLYVVQNNVSGGFSVTLKTSAGTGITVPNGTTMFLRCDGTDVVDAFTRASSLSLGTALTVANGGTGQTTASAAFNALSPITTTGDLILGNGVNSATRLPIGSSGFVLTSDGTTASWQAAVTVSGNNTWTGIQTFTNSLLRLLGSSTGYTTFTSLNVSASNFTLTLPAANTTVPVATQVLTFSGPTAARTITFPDANFTAARTDAANSFTGTQTFLGSVVPATLTADSVGYTGTPLNEQSTAYTLVAADAGKSVVHPISDNNARTFTIPANGSVAYPVGTTITFINMINTVTIAITTDTMYLAGAGTTGSRTLAAYGMATAVKMTSTTWIISGNGLT